MDLRGGGESENLERLCESMSTESSEPKKGVGQKVKAVASPKSELLDVLAPESRRI